MKYLFLAFLILSVTGLVLGLIRPVLVMPPGKRSNRGVVVLVYGLAAAVSLALFVLTADSSLWEGWRSTAPATLPAARPESNARSFFRLSIDRVAAEKGNVTVSGTTNLPDGSRLSVDFDVAGPPDNESDMAVGEETTVQGGRFSVSITPPHTPAFARGPYRVTVLFSPRVQSEAVLRRVGKDGESLAGENVRETFGFRVLEVKKEVNLAL